MAKVKRLDRDGTHRGAFDRAKKKIIKQIKRIGNRYEKDVLFWIYIDGLKWEKVAEKVGLSLCQTYVYHGRGLKKMLK